MTSSPGRLPGLCRSLGETRRRPCGRRGRDRRRPQDVPAGGQLLIPTVNDGLRRARAAASETTCCSPLTAISRPRRQFTARRKGPGRTVACGDEAAQCRREAC
jgi:hypothetical protein